jgi:uncharacterized protein (UPF0548 family)
MSATLHPRWLGHEPTASEADAFLAVQRRTGGDAAFSYPDVGGTRRNDFHPAGFNLDHNRVQIGTGDGDFAAACAALQGWRMFPRPWTRIQPAGAPIRVGQTLAMQAYAFGFWWLSACRIVYVLDEPAPPPVVRRFGFAYGTLPAHVESGEERFSVELLADGSVWYDLRAFSRPHFWPVRLARPLARRLQQRFVRESQAAMRAAVAAGAEVSA